MDWQKFCTIGAFVVAVVWGGAQFYIWYKHGEIGMNGLIGFAILVVLLFVSGLMNLKAAGKNRATLGGRAASPIPFVPAPLPPSVAKDKPKDARVFLSPNIDHKYLMDMFEGRTSIQASSMAASFLGKWMSLSGELSEILYSRPGGQAQVTFKRPGLTDIYMYFDNEWVDRLLVLKHGDVLHIIGQLREISRGHIQLDHCELVTPQ
jgi:hypothetical protein